MDLYSGHAINRSIFLFNMVKIMKTITMTTKTYKLKEGTKTVYELTSEKSAQITEQQYDSTAGFDVQRDFRRLGGSETATMGYTSLGYKVIKLISKSPDRSTKIVREFDIDQVN